MKTTNMRIAAIVLVIIGLTTMAQARISFLTNNYESNSFILNTALGNKYCPNAVSPLTDAEIDEIIRVHNATRSEVGTPPLKWNCALATFSQNWANKDTFEHSSEQERQNIIPGSLAGENLSVDSETNAGMLKLIQGWIDEKPHWNNDTKTCAEGKVCGHYTQMVWRSTTELGCGVYRKSDRMGEEFKGKASYFVCTYNPAGNDGNAAY